MQTPSLAPVFAAQPSWAASDDFVFDGVHLDLGDQPVLRDINLALRRRETVAIIGESGCGKTTLLKIMIGLFSPTKGKAWFRGKSLTGMTHREQMALRRNFGFLFQAAALFDSMSVYDNIAFGLRTQGILSEREIQPIVEKQLEEVGLSAAVGEKFPSELSGGMRKRVGLARALALSPEFMLFDEPTTGLDPVMTDVINELILKVRRNLGITGILVTHEMRTVRKVADRVIMLAPLASLEPHENQILFDGSVAELDISTDQRIRSFIQGDSHGAAARALSRKPAQESHRLPQLVSGQPVHAPPERPMAGLRWIDPEAMQPAPAELPQFIPLFDRQKVESIKVPIRPLESFATPVSTLLATSPVVLDSILASAATGGGNVNPALQSLQATTESIQQHPPTMDAAHSQGESASGPASESADDEASESDESDEEEDPEPGSTADLSPTAAFAIGTLGVAAAGGLAASAGSEFGGLSALPSWLLERENTTEEEHFSSPAHDPSPAADHAEEATQLEAPHSMTEEIPAELQTQVAEVQKESASPGEASAHPLASEEESAVDAAPLFETAEHETSPTTREEEFEDLDESLASDDDDSPGEPVKESPVTFSAIPSLIPENRPVDRDLGPEELDEETEPDDSNAGSLTQEEFDQDREESTDIAQPTSAEPQEALYEAPTSASFLTADLPVQIEPHPAQQEQETAAASMAQGEPPAEVDSPLEVASKSDLADRLFAAPIAAHEPEPHTAQAIREAEIVAPDVNESANLDAEASPVSHSAPKDAEEPAHSAGSAIDLEELAKAGATELSAKTFEDLTPTFEEPRSTASSEEQEAKATLLEQDPFEPHHEAGVLEHDATPKPPVVAESPQHEPDENLPPIELNGGEQSSGAEREPASAAELQETMAPLQEEPVAPATEDLPKEESEPVLSQSQPRDESEDVPTSEPSARPIVAPESNEASIPWPAREEPPGSRAAPLETVSPSVWDQPAMADDASADDEAPSAENDGQTPMVRSEAPLPAWESLVGRDFEPPIAASEPSASDQAKQTDHDDNQDPKSEKSEKSREKREHTGGEPPVPKTLDPNLARDRTEGEDES